MFRSADLPLRLTSCDHLYSRGVVVAVPRYRVFRPSAGANRACFLTESDHRFSEATADVRRSWCNYVPLPVPLFALPVGHFSSIALMGFVFCATRTCRSGSADALLLGCTKKDQGPSVLTATQQRSRMRRNVTGSLRRQWRRAFRDGEAERLAVLTLITSSIMVACCTGRSAGFCAVASIASRAATV